MSAVKKIMFFPASMKGHLCHTARISEWFLEFEEYEVHVCASPDSKIYLPDGIVFHPNPKACEHEVFEEIFSQVGEGRNPTECMGIMMEKMDLEKSMVGQATFAIAKLKEVKPDVVLYEHAYNFGNVMLTACRQLDIPNVMLIAMARPETASPALLLPLLFKYPRAVIKMARGLSSANKEFEAAVGCRLLPASEKPITIFPGAQILCEVPPKSNEIYTGPFYPLPLDLVSSPMSRSTSSRKLGRSNSSGFSLELESIPGLREWIDTRRDAGKQLVYIALGTLAKPSSELLARIVDALDGDEQWSVIWALPEAHQARLPKQLSVQWFVCKFLPQAAIFGAKMVDCFVSHCGGSSTTEAISNGIPMVCMPFFGDQFEWADSISKHVKAGVKVDKFYSTSAELRGAVRNVLDDESYKQNAKRTAREMTENAKMRLDILGVKLQGTKRVGVPVAAAVIEKVLIGEDPLEVVPKSLRPAPQVSRWLFCSS